MRWDDIQILGRIHELENGESGFLLSGFSLMEKIRVSPPADPQADARLFAKELLLARDAGYLLFTEHPHPGLFADPRTDAHYWLQQIGDIQLTLSGRDRGLGRQVLKELPDPDEDDGRNIASLTLQEVADAIGGTYSPAQLHRFLRDSGVADDYLADLVGTTSSETMYSLLENLHEGGSPGRRLLRSFLGRWLSNRLQSWPDLAVRKQVLTHLAQQGWHLKVDRLVVGDQLPAPSDPRLIVGPIVATIVRTDLVGSTQLRKNLGESAWADRRDEHYATLRRLLEDYGGTEINDLGDGLLVWFTSPVSAVQFSQHAFSQSAGKQMAMRIAVDAGECTIAEPPDSLDGLTLARVERLVARTAPNELLVSDSVRALAGTMHITFRVKNVELADFGPMNAHVVEQSAESL